MPLLRRSWHGAALHSRRPGGGCTKRILVMGVSSGVGKSTLAAALGEALGIHVIHIDAIYWRPGWVAAPLETFARAQVALVAEDAWIIEGNYLHTYHLRSERADTIIYMELPLMVCLVRVLKRLIRNFQRTRQDLGVGCPEHFDLGFIMFICKTYYPRKKDMARLLQAFETSGADKTVIVLKGRKAIRTFIAGLRDRAP